MAKVTEIKSKVPVTTYEEKTTGITLELTMDEAQELRTLISDIHVSSSFRHVKAIRDVLRLAGLQYQFFTVRGSITPVAS